MSRAGEQPTGGHRKNSTSCPPSPGPSDGRSESWGNFASAPSASLPVPEKCRSFRESCADGRDGRLHPPCVREAASASAPAPPAGVRLGDADAVRTVRMPPASAADPPGSVRSPAPADDADGADAIPTIRRRSRPTCVAPAPYPRRPTGHTHVEISLSRSGQERAATARAERRPRRIGRPPPTATGGITGRLGRSRPHIHGPSRARGADRSARRSGLDRVTSDGSASPALPPARLAPCGHSSAESSASRFGGAAASAVPPRDDTVTTKRRIEEGTIRLSS